MTIKNHLQRYLNRTSRDGTCFIWQGAVNTDGYARVAFGGSSNGKLHRIVYALVNPEEDISKLVVRHSCDNTLCINPEHLLSGSPADNCMDRDTRGRHAWAMFTPEEVQNIRNLYASGTYSHRTLGEELGVKAKTIGSIVRKENYAWVT